MKNENPKLNIEFFPIDGLKLITVKSFSDERGFFCERFKFSDFEEQQIPTSFVQDNFSRSYPKVLRGLHFQWDRPQGKLVTCMSGRIYDVAVDIRKGSPTFGKYVSIELSGERPQWFWIPPGFAHGFCVLGEEPADVFYKCDNEYNSQGEGGIHWADPELNIQWPDCSFQISSRDDSLPAFKSYLESPRFVWNK